MKHYEEDQFGVDTEHSYRMEDSYEQDSVPVSPADQLERYGGWLSSIPRDDVIMLRETPEYQDFIRAFERLGSAHRRAISMNRSSVSMDDASSHKPSLHSFVLADTLTSNFLQFLTADDVILRVFEFLECHSLIRMALTCTRFRQLAYRSATQRTFDVAVSRQLNSVMQLLRAKEQIEGVGNGMHDSHVRVPILLLGRRILVQDCGDPEMNGIYSCTSCNGNGFVFTKPRYSNIRVRRPSHQTSQSPWDRHIDMQHTHHEQDLAMLPQQNLHPDGVPNHPLNVPMRRANGHVPHVGRNVQLGAGVAEQGPVSRFESEVVQPGQQLRCIIAKRFSNERILWYLSKEVVETLPHTNGSANLEAAPPPIVTTATTTSPETSINLPNVAQSIRTVRPQDVTQVFSFWVKLMVIGDASPDLCRYPSQTSILSRHGEGWQSLTATRNLRPPTVELLD